MVMKFMKKQNSKAKLRNNINYFQSPIGKSLTPTIRLKMFNLKFDKLYLKPKHKNAEILTKFGYKKPKPL